MLDAFTIESRGCRMVSLIDYSTSAARGKKVVLYKHGFMGHKITPHRMMVNFAHQLVQQDYSVFRFDCAGAGDSEGDCHMTTLAGELEDTLTVLRFIRQELRPERLVVLGYSMGGCIASLATQVEEVDGLLLWSPVGQPFEAFAHILGKERFAQGVSGYDVDFGGDRVSHKFFVGLEDARFDPLRAVSTYTKPVRIVHGGGDTFVPPQNALAYTAVAKDVKLHIVPGANHSYDTVPQQDELFSVSSRYLEEIMA